MAQMAETASALTSPEGVSLAGFRAFFDLHGKGNGRAAWSDLTTDDVKHSIVIPATTLTRCAYVDLLRATPGAVGTANVFVSHVYSGKIIDAYDALDAWEERQGGG
jgi:hypothetical protein